MAKQSANRLTLRQMKSRNRTRRKKRLASRSSRVRERELKSIREQRKKKPGDEGLFKSLLSLLPGK